MISRRAQQSGVSRGVVLSSPLPMAARTRCVWPWASLAAPSIGLRSRSWGTRGNLAGSLQPGGLVMWATAREAPTRVVGWACYCMGGFLLLVSSRSLLLVGVRSHSCVCFFGLLAGDLSDVACNAWACTAGLSGPARAASFASPSVSRRWRSRGFPNCRKSGRLGGLALRCSAALRIN